MPFRQLRNITKRRDESNISSVRILIRAVERLVSITCDQQRAYRNAVNDDKLDSRPRKYITSRWKTPYRLGRCVSSARSRKRKAFVNGSLINPFVLSAADRHASWRSADRNPRATLLRPRYTTVPWMRYYGDWNKSMAHPSTFYPRSDPGGYSQTRAHAHTFANKLLRGAVSSRSLSATAARASEPGRGFKSDLELTSIEIPIAALSEALCDEGSREAPSHFPRSFHISPMYYHTSTGHKSFGVFHFFSSSLSKG